MRLLPRGEVRGFTGYLFNAAMTDAGFTVHRESPRPRPATRCKQSYPPLAWVGSTISRAPFHAGGRTVERSAYRLPNTKNYISIKPHSKQNQ